MRFCSGCTAKAVKIVKNGTKARDQRSEIGGQQKTEPQNLGATENQRSEDRGQKTAKAGLSADYAHYAD